MLERISYEISEDIFGDDLDVINSVVEDYSGSTYICDAITSVADESVPIYNSDLFDKAGELNYWVEEAGAQGLYDGFKGVDLVRILQIACYEYYSNLFYSNEEQIIYNIMIDYLNSNKEEFITNLTDDMESDLLERLEELSGEYDSNDMYDTITDAVDELLEEYFSDNEEEQESKEE